MIPKFRAVVFAHHRRKDGTYNVKINVYFNGKERRLPTNIYCTKGDLTRSFHIKNNDIISKVNEEIGKMQKAISDLSYFDLEEKDVEWLVAQIKAKLHKVTFRLDFFQYADQYLKSKKASTATTYKAALNAFAKFLGKREIDINDITRLQLVEFMEWWDKQPIMAYRRGTGFVPCSKQRKPMQASTAHVGKLGIIYKDAKKRHNDEDSGIIMIPRSPFDNLPKVKISCDGQKPLPFDLMQRLILAEVPRRCYAQRKAIDTFIVSFCFMGINMADLIEQEFPEGDMLDYNRKKTRDRRADKAQMCIDIPPEVLPYMWRLGAGTGKAMLPELLAMSKDEEALSGRVNQGLKAWCLREGVESFSFYAARKTWATLARKVAEKSIVDECLAHVGDFRLTDIYAARPWDKINEVNRKVLDLFEWPTL